MAGLKLVVELDDKGSIKTIETLDEKFNKFKRNVKGGSAQIAAGFSKIGKGVKQVAAPFGRFASMAKLALAGLGAAAVVVGAKFEQSMANVASVANTEGRSVTEVMNELSDVARHWGSQTAFAASEAADGMYSLASAGLTAGQISQSIGGVLQYAGATMADLGQAAEATVQAMKMFGMTAAETDRIVNVFAAGISSSMLNSERLKEALAQVGSTAASVGMDLEKTVGVLGALHNMGQLGSIAGTRLKNVLVQLASPSKKLEELLHGVTFTGDNMAEVIDKLNERGATAGEVYDAFGRIGGGAMLAMMKMGGTALDEMIEGVTGTNKAFEMYQQQMNTVQNQFKIFKSGVEENMIAVFMELKPVIRASIQYLIDLVATLRPYIVGITKIIAKWVMEHKSLAKTVMAGVAIFGGLVVTLSLIAPAVTAAIGVFNIMVGVFGVIRGAIATYKASWIAAHIASIGPWGILIAVGVAAIGILIYYIVKYRDKVGEMMDTVVGWFKTGWEWIANAAKWVGNKIWEYMEKPFNWIVDKVKWFAEKIVAGFDWMFPGVRDAVGEFLDDVGGKVADVAGTVGDAVVDAAEWTRDAAVDIGTATAEKAEQIIARIVSATDKLKQAGSGGPSYSQDEFVGPPSYLQYADDENSALEYQNDLLADQLAKLSWRNALNIANHGISESTVAVVNKMFAEYAAGHRLQVDALIAMGDAYDTFYESLWDKEMSWNQRRQAAWMSFKRSFLKSQADMLKQWLVMQIKTLLISENARRAATAKERFEYAKLGAIRAYTAMASIPIIGPALGAIAAAAAFAFLMAFHSGGRVQFGANEGAAILMDDEYVIRRDAARSVGYATLDQINATGKLPTATNAPMSLSFEIHAATGDDATIIAETIEDKVVPILEDLIVRRRFNVGVA